MPQLRVIKAVLETVRGLPGYPHLDVIDLSCAEGEILDDLHREGCRVRGSHYRDDDYRMEHPRQVLEEVPIDRGVDLHRPLPYATASFDVVILTEVLEHLESHVTVILEAGRILKPGGHLLLTSPNIHRLHSRWQFFLTGTHKLIRRRVGWDLQRGDLYAFHIHPVDFCVLHTVLHQASLRIEKLKFTQFKLRHGAWLLLWPIYWMAIRLEFGGDRRDSIEFRRGEKDLRRWMARPAMLASEQLLVVAERAVDAAKGAEDNEAMNGARP